MRVVNLCEYRNKGVISALEVLLALARAGEIQGFAFIVKFGPHDHRGGATGDYKKHPDQALGATFRMGRQLMDAPPSRF